MDELSEEDKMTVARARKMQRFLSQPFQVAEVFTGSPGKYVDLANTIAGFKARRGRGGGGRWSRCFLGEGAACWERKRLLAPGRARFCGPAAAARSCALCALPSHAEPLPPLALPLSCNNTNAPQGILAGKYDDLPEMAFYMVGDIEEVVAKADKMAKVRAGLWAGGWQGVSGGFGRGFGLQGGALRAARCTLRPSACGRAFASPLNADPPNPPPKPKPKQTNRTWRSASPPRRATARPPPRRP